MRSAFVHADLRLGEGARDVLARVSSTQRRILRRVAASIESPDGQVDPVRRALGGLALVAGGALWIWAALALAAKPYGDTAELRLLRPTEPLSATYRNSDDLAPVLALAVIFTLAGLALLHARAAWASGRPGQAAVVLLALGALVIAPWPLLLLGFLSWIVGMLALAIAALRHGVLPRSVAYMLIVSAVLLFLFNTEDDRALFQVAPATVWIWLGLRALLRRPALGDSGAP